MDTFEGLQALRLQSGGAPRRSEPQKSVIFALVQAFLGLPRSGQCVSKINKNQTFETASSKFRSCAVEAESLAVGGLLLCLLTSLKRARLRF